ncbi:unnamed protein product, partial [Discosporangium mesarthrocarpum]
GRHRCPSRSRERREVGVRQDPNVRGLLPTLPRARILHGRGLPALRVARGEGREHVRRGAVAGAAVRGRRRFGERPSTQVRRIPGAQAEGNTPRGALGLAQSRGLSHLRCPPPHGVGS